MSLTSYYYPFTVVSGKILTTDDYPTIIKQAIKSAILTKLEERVYQVEYGTDNYLFNVGSNYLIYILADVRRSIDLALQYYDQINYQLYGSFSDAGTLVIQCEYQIGPETFIVSNIQA